MPIIPINSLCLDNVFGVIEKQQGSDEFLKNKCLWLKYPLWFRKKPQDLNSHPQVAIQAHKKQCNAITESWISGVPNSTRFGLN